MASIITQKFILSILNELNAKTQFDSASIEYIKTVLELQTHHLFESSIKFMRKEKRQIIIAQDVVMASKDNGHDSLILQNSFQHEEKEDRVIFAQDNYFQQQTRALQTSSEIEKPKIQGKWIYLKGKIPALTYNFGFKCLSQKLRQQKPSQNQSRQLVSIIKDNPYSLLTDEQFEYFEKMCQAMAQNVKPYGDFTVEGDLNNLFPFFLKFLGERQLNQTSICFLLKLIENKYIWTGIQYYLKKVLYLLLTYRGIYSLQVGNKIAQLVCRFSDKYPILRDMFVGYKDESYSTILKKISFQLLVGVSLQIDENLWEKCQKDCQNDNRMAIICRDALLCYSSQLQHFKELLLKKLNFSIYWHPCSELNGDPYLHMF